MDEKKINTLREQANRLLIQNKWNELIKTLSDIIRLSPDDAIAYCQRGFSYAHIGRWDEAIADFGEAIRLNPKFAEAYNGRGNVWLSKGEHDLAIHDFTHCIGMKPNDAEVHANRGNAYNMKGEYDRAIADHTRAIEINPQLHVAYVNRGVCYAKKGEQDHAIDDFTQAIKIEPKSAEAHYNRGLAYVNKNEHDRAIADFGEAIQFAPDNSPEKAAAIHNRAMAMAGQGAEEMRKSLTAQFQQEFHKDFVQRKKEQEREKEYGERLEKTESLIRRALWGLGVLIPTFYTLLFCIVLWSTQGTMRLAEGKLPEGFLPFGPLGLVFPTALLASPLAWWVRTLLRDKAKYAILREDAARKQRVMEYAIISPRDAHNPVVLKSLDHWMQQSAADLLMTFENKRMTSSTALSSELKLPSSGDEK